MSALPQLVILAIKAPGPADDEGKEHQEDPHQDDCQAEIIGIAVGDGDGHRWQLDQKEQDQHDPDPVEKVKKLASLLIFTLLGFLLPLLS